jgi:low affinity Fe/Cu permease
MSQTKAVEPGKSHTTAVPERLPLFQRIADKVSYGMGTPLNIGVWIIIVVGWTLIFALHLVNAKGTFLPTWFTSTGYNFPLNLVTTVAELYIGFLVGASSNRSERNLEATLASISAQDQQIDAVDVKLSRALAQNTALTKEIHELTKIIHATVVLGEKSAQPGPTT